MVVRTLNLAARSWFLDRNPTSNIVDDLSNILQDPNRADYVTNFKSIILESYLNLEEAFEIW